LSCHRHFLPTLLSPLYRHLNLSHGSLAGEEKSDPCPRRRDLIEATKTFRGYKSPRDDKIGAARRAERHAACRARTHARGILMGSSSRATPEYAEALDCHFLYISYSRNVNRIQTLIFIEDSSQWIIITYLKNRPYSSFYLFLILLSIFKLADLY